MSRAVASPAPLPAVAGRGAARRAARRGSGLLLALATLLLVAVLAAAAFGLRVRIEQTGSMAPALQPGDLVIVEQIPASAAAVGDVIGVRAADGRVIVHRVRELAAAPGGALAVTTQGDANPTSERWTIAAGDDVALVRGRMPHVGAAVDAVRGPAGAAAVLLAALLLAGGALRKIWSRP